jgi:ATP-dependent Clp protease ATP-binding subunit ClpA
MWCGAYFLRSEGLPVSAVPSWTKFFFSAIIFSSGTGYTQETRLIYHQFQDTEKTALFVELHPTQVEAKFRLRNGLSQTEYIYHRQNLMAVATNDREVSTDVELAQNNRVFKVFQTFDNESTVRLTNTHVFLLYIGKQLVALDSNGHSAFFPHKVTQLVMNKELQWYRKIRFGPAHPKGIDGFLFLKKGGTKAILVFTNLNTKEVSSIEVTLPAKVTKPEELLAAGGTRSGRLVVLIKVGDKEQTYAMPGYEALEVSPRIIAALSPTKDTTPAGANGKDDSSSLLTTSDFSNEDRYLRMAQSANSNFPYPQDFTAQFRSNSEVEAYLKDRVFGQDAIIESLIQSAYSKQLTGGSQNGGRELGDLIFLVGLPGTGKDTIAEALVDARFGRKGAYVEHLFSLPRIRTDSDLNILTGSAPGYVGSDGIPNLIRFVVDHSGGEYIIEHKQAASKSEVSWIVKRNPAWQEGVVTPGTFSPQSGVIFMNELHDWNQEGMNLFGKEFLEHGTVRIANAGTDGLSEITFRGDRIAASNHLVDRYSSLDPKLGQRGPRWKLDKIKQAHSTLTRDKSNLLDYLKEAKDSDGKLLLRPEIISRINPYNVHLMAPLEPKHLSNIVNSKVNSLFARMSRGHLIKNSFGANTTFKISKELQAFLHEYEYEPEEMGRVIDYKIQALLIDPLVTLFRTGKLTPSNTKKTVSLGLVQQPDGSAVLSLTTHTEGGNVQTVSIPITQTKIDKKDPMISEEEFKRLSTAGQRASQVVFGLDHIVEQINAAMLSIANRARSAASGKARGFVLLGPPGTGKTLLANTMTKELSSGGEPTKISFGEISSRYDFELRLFGTKDRKSEFADALDRGQKFFIFDEVLNVHDPINTLKALYDLFEVETKLFPDSEIARKLKGVVIIMTGNPNLGLYELLPKDLARIQEHYAWKTVSDMIAANPQIRDQMIAKTVPSPLTGRIGGSNIFFVAPHTYRSLRQVAYKFVMTQFKQLNSADNSRRWNLKFVSEDDARKTIDALEDEAYVVKEQARSIESYLKSSFIEVIEAALLRQPDIGRGDTVIIQYQGRKKLELGADGQLDQTKFKLVLQNGREIPLHTRGNTVLRSLPKSMEYQKLVAFHEVGHLLGTAGLNRDTSLAIFLSILEGVTQIGGNWLAYDGVASHEKMKREDLHLDVIKIKMAGLQLGGVCEELASAEGVPSAGHRNDLERATELAETAIVRWRLAGEAWTEGVPPETMGMTEYKMTLSQPSRRKLEALTRELLRETREYARRYAILNWDNYVVPLSKLLYQKGILDRKALTKFNNEHQLTYMPPSLARDKTSAILEQLQNFAQTKASLVGYARNNKVLIASERATWVNFDGVVGADSEKIFANWRKNELKDLAVPPELLLEAGVKAARPIPMPESNELRMAASKSPIESVIETSACVQAYD